MKKFLGILFAFLVLAGCDDGDATVDSISFDDSNVAVCNNLVFKITENRAMILNFDNVAQAFVKDATLEGSPRQFTVGSDVEVTYRVYSGALSSTVFCSSPPPIDPAAILEWPAESGKVEITTTLVPTEPDPTTGQIGISTYRHSVVLKDLRLKKPDGTTQVFTEYLLGTYQTNPDNALSLVFDPEDVRLCPDTNLVYNAPNNGGKGLFIQNIDAALLDTSVLGTVKSAAITNVNNIVVYRLLEAAIPAGTNENYFCTGATSPATKEEWRAVSGTIEVVTIIEAGYYKHSIRIKNAWFRKGNSQFFYGPDRLYGELKIAI